MKAIFLWALLLGMLGTDPNLADPQWGIGVLMSEKGFPTEVAIDFPARGIQYALSSDGPFVGEIWARGENWERPVFYGNDASYHDIDRQGIREIGYEGSVLQVYAVSEGRCAIRGSGAREFLWVDEAILSTKGYNFIPWGDFLLKNDASYHPSPKNGLNLRAGAGTEHVVIIKLEKEKHVIKFTGKREGIWMEVNAFYWPERGIFMEKPGTKKYKGWIKALDDKGFPNVWYATRGC